MYVTPSSYATHIGERSIQYCVNEISPISPNFSNMSLTLSITLFLLYFDMNIPFHCFITQQKCSEISSTTHHIREQWLPMTYFLSSFSRFHLFRSLCVFGFVELLSKFVHVMNNGWMSAALRKLNEICCSHPCTQAPWILVVASSKQYSESLRWEESTDWLRMTIRHLKLSKWLSRHDPQFFKYRCRPHGCQYPARGSSIKSFMFTRFAHNNNLCWKGLVLSCLWLSSHFGFEFIHYQHGFSGTKSEKAH